ncbi:MAG: flavodoxin family protein [Vulcanimicrobiota bacterium]
MKVVGFNGSPRKNGNTSILINKVFEVLNREGIETELVHIGDKPVQGCKACFKCFDAQNRKCAIGDDMINENIARIIEADGVIMGSPVYFTDVTPEMKALIDRAGMTSIANNYIYKRKPAAAVVSVRRGGALHTFDTINHFFLINQMMVVGSTYWNMGMGRQIGDVEKDEEGIRTMENLGNNMAWLLKKIN